MSTFLHIPTLKSIKVMIKNTIKSIRYEKSNNNNCYKWFIALFCFPFSIIINYSNIKRYSLANFSVNNVPT